MKLAVCVKLFHDFAYVLFSFSLTSWLFYIYKMNNGSLNTLQKETTTDE